jgi:hypothetical protein
MRPSLLKKFHQIFLFPGRNEKDYEDLDKDPAMKKTNKHAMTKFSDALAAWKTRVQARIIDKKEPYSEIAKDNPTITEEQFQIFKEACEAEAAASSNRTILLMMDSMSYTTCWSTDGITRTFTCHLHPAMPIFCNGQIT